MFQIIFNDGDLKILKKQFNESPDIFLLRNIIMNMKNLLLVASYLLKVSR